MPLITVFVHNKKGESIANHTLEADFLPRKGDTIWIRTLSIKDGEQLPYRNLKVIDVEHSVSSADREFLENGKLTTENGQVKIRHAKISYNVITKVGAKNHNYKMTKWESTIVTIIATPRFGQFRKCKKCGAEQAKTAAGEGIHDELRVKCQGGE